MKNNIPEEPIEVLDLVAQQLKYLSEEEEQCRQKYQLMTGSLTLITVREYLVREFLVMANRKGNKPEDKLRKLNSYLHSNFPECFELLNI